MKIIYILFTVVALLLGGCATNTSTGGGPVESNVPTIQDTSDLIGLNYGIITSLSYTVLDLYNAGRITHAKKLNFLLQLKEAKTKLDIASKALALADSSQSATVQDPFAQALETISVVKQALSLVLGQPITFNLEEIDYGQCSANITVHRYLGICTTPGGAT